MSVRNLIPYTMFQRVLFPPAPVSEDQAVTSGGPLLTLRRTVRFECPPQALLTQLPIVIFDFETTGFDPKRERIIELGAQRFEKGVLVGEFETFIDPGRTISPEIQKITGISPHMLVGQPKETQVISDFLRFAAGALLVAHNATFDMGFLVETCSRAGIDLNWTACCSLKLARSVLPALESKSLDALAEHYDLRFEARHRSIGDVKVTAEVFRRLLRQGGYTSWQDLMPFKV